ncbi:MAG: hypothetical protein ABI999_08850 [Acidobacteriota bacterium]
MTKLIVTLATVFIVLIQVHAAESQSVQSGDFSSITRKELEVLFADIAVKNPVALKRLLDDPESKGKQLDNLRQLLAFASQAQKDGLADEPTNRQELINIRAETIAVNYDNELNKNKAPKPQLGYITDRQVREYWGDASKKEARDAAFKRFIDSKLGLLKKADIY